MSNEVLHKQSLKRKRQSSSKTERKRPRLAEEKTPSSKTHNCEDTPCLDVKTQKTTKRVCFSETRPNVSLKKNRQSSRKAWSETAKDLVDKQNVSKEKLCLDPKVKNWFNKAEQETWTYSSTSSGSGLFDAEGEKTNHSEFIRKISSDHRFARYVMGDLIGYGSFGLVVAATRKTDGAPVAIKFVSKESVHEFKVINGRPVPAEAYLQNKTRHRYVIRMYELFTTNEHYVYVMERPEICKDLFDILHVRATLTENEARRYFSQILKANICCEENGVLHRDLKPENILVDMLHDEAKLIDFGLASEVQEEPFLKFRGTKAYTPPEYFSTGKYDGCQGTVWQLGILLVEMLSPVMAFDKPEQALTVSPRIPENLSPGQYVM
ncbi:unnamed protein product [Porites lobata]|uniref:Serine/threonine-protein kinase 1 n=1 Tax=Porites lobata TaxID=104759 RepID=A0ABN8MR07_9CNID|nr:unnamed protein product [Porites lobata]